MLYADPRRVLKGNVQVFVKAKQGLFCVLCEQSQREKKKKKKYLDNLAVSQSQRPAGEGAEKPRQKHHALLFALVIALLIRCVCVSLKMWSE